VQLWHDCPFRHQRSEIATAEREAIVNRLVEFFVLGSVELTLFRTDADPDTDPILAIKDPHITCRVPTRRGRTIIASQFAARFGAYLGLDDAPPQRGDAAQTDSADQAVPITGSAGPTAQASGRMAKAKAFNGRRRIGLDAAEFRTCAELSFRSAKVCEYFARALEILKSKGIKVDGIIVSHNDTTDMEPLLSALRKHRLNNDICFIDASHNELETLRFLFYLRANYANLVSLRLLDNPITRKPEYREQLRKTLPDLMRLDDESVRKPPLNLPHPKPSVIADPPRFYRVSRFVAALLDSFERNLVDDDFVQRHFHPSVTLSMSVHPDCMFKLPSYAMTAQEQAAQIKMSDIERGKVVKKLKETWLVTPQDAREVELFGVSVRTANRDLRIGKESIQKYARGPLPVLTAYTSTLYPERFPTEHHLHFASWDHMTMPIPLATLSSSVKIRPVAADPAAMPASVKKKAQPKLPTAEKKEDIRTVFLASGAAPDFDMVTVHGVMTWRIPSVHGEAAFRCFYDRTFTVVPRPGSKGHDAERTRDPKQFGNDDDLIDALDDFQLYNDQVTLRPIVTVKTTEVHRRDVKTTNDVSCLPHLKAGKPIFIARDQPDLVRRLALVYQTDEAVVRSALERSTSDACLHRVLEEITGAAAGKLGVEAIDETEVVDDPEALENNPLVRRDSTWADLEPALRRHQSEPFVQLPEAASAA
jgi:hypothetical protein